MTAEGASARVAPTLEAVAQRAGVSRATVSRVVNGSPRVSDETVATVTAAIAELRYTPNRAARSLANRKSMAIALVIPEETTRFFGDPYFAAIVQGISNVLDDTGYVLNLHLASSTGSFDQTVAYLLGGNADGALVVSHHRHDRLAEHLSGLGLPAVFVGRPWAAVQTLSWVDTDNVAGGRLAAQRLVDGGRRRLATIAGPADMAAGADRLAGWCEVVEGAGLSASAVRRGDFTESGGLAAARALLAEHPDFDGLFAASDLMAAGALRALAEAGRSVPGDVAVVGYDDLEVAERTSPTLTTVRNPVGEMVERATRLLLDQLADVGEREAEQVVFPPALVSRDSA